MAPSAKASANSDARRPHVAGHEHPVVAPVRVGGEAGEGGADALDELGVELVGSRAADVVGLEDGVEVGHAPKRGRLGRRTASPPGTRTVRSPAIDGSSEVGACHDRRIAGAAAPPGIDAARRPPGRAPDVPPAPGYWKASDGNWYPPQPPTATPPPPPPPRPTAAMGSTAQPGHVRDLRSAGPTQRLRHRRPGPGDHQHRAVLDLRVRHHPRHPRHRLRRPRARPGPGDGRGRPARRPVGAGHRGAGDRRARRRGRGPVHRPHRGRGGRHRVRPDQHRSVRRGVRSRPVPQDPDC